MDMIDTEKLDKLQRYSRAIAALSLALFFALIVIGLWSLWRVRKEVADLKETKQSLDRQVADAKEELQGLEAQREVLSQTISEIAKQRPESVKDAINQATAVQPDKPVIGQENKRVENTREVIDRLIQTAPSIARNLTRIYLHISDEKQRPRARLIAKQLKQAGYLVPGIEDVGERGRRIPTQVRYYARTEAERDEAQKIIDLLQGWGIQAQNQPIRDASRPWQYEIWFGSDFK